MSALDTYLAALPGRCTHGYHPKQRHSCTKTPSPAWTSPQSPDSSAGEWPFFVSVIRKVARADGTVHQGDVRPMIRGRIPAKHVGLLWKRARREGLVLEAGHERSDDELGKNAGRMEPYYRLSAAQRGRPAA